MRTGLEQEGFDEHGIERRGLRRLSPRTQVALGVVLCVGIALAAVYAFVLGTSIFSRGVDIWWWLVFYATIGLAASAVPIARNLIRAGFAVRRSVRAASSPGISSTSSPVNKDDSERQNERQVLEALERYGEITPVRAALETTLTVAEADRILFDLAKAGHLEVKVVGGQLVYSFG